MQAPPQDSVGRAAKPLVVRRRAAIRCERVTHLTSIRAAPVAFVALLFLTISSSAQVASAPRQGLRENDPRVHALTNARIVTAPGKTIDKGTLLIRDGLIVAEAGPDIEMPPEARVWDLAGKTIYPGFIDAYSRVGLPETLQPEPLRPDVDRDNPDAKPKEIPREPAKGTHAWNPRVTPERNAADFLKPDKKATREVARPRVSRARWWCRRAASSAARAR